MYSLQKVRSWTRSLFAPRYSEAGAHIPPELFPRILFYVSLDDRRKQIREHAEVEARRTNTPIDDWDLLTKLMEASPAFGSGLLSQYLFTDRMLTIRTAEEAKVFGYYAAHGSQELIPIAGLIKGMHVVYLYHNSHRSILDLLHVPLMRDKFFDLSIRGPVTNTAALSPSVTAYRKVVLSSMDFPSLLHAIKYIKHFKYACHRQQIEVSVEKCTDDVFLCWQVAMIAGPAWAFDVMRRVHSFYKDNGLIDNDGALSLSFKGCESAEVTGYQPLAVMQFFYDQADLRLLLSLSNIEIHFTCDIKPLTPLPYRSGRTSPRPIRIMAVMLYVDLPGSSFEKIRLAFDFPAFRKTVERYCIIHVVVFAFESFDVLKSVVREHPMLTEPLAHSTEQRVYRFAYKRYAYHTWVLVDPITMEPQETERRERILAMFERS
ncbi:hypothetical protein BC629DRAFT_1519968 [Irpex lacteus]|nr:hypothetical protein BC629DRAFT_1519968 [Irpex lacteus]